MQLTLHNFYLDLQGLWQNPWIAAKSVLVVVADAH